MWGNGRDGDWLRRALAPGSKRLSAARFAGSAGRYRTRSWRCRSRRRARRQSTMTSVALSGSARRDETTRPSMRHNPRQRSENAWPDDGRVSVRSASPEIQLGFWCPLPRLPFSSPAGLRRGSSFRTPRIPGRDRARWSRYRRPSPAAQLIRSTDPGLPA